MGQDLPVTPRCKKNGFGISGLNQRFGFFISEIVLSDEFDLLTFIDICPEFPLDFVMGDR